MSEQVAVAKVTAQAANGAVLAKLLIFSLSLAVAPISSFFLSQRYLWNGNATYAAITAVLAANGVLVAYIVSSVLEDRRDRSESKEQDSKKER